MHHAAAGFSIRERETQAISSESPLVQQLTSCPVGLMPERGGMVSDRGQKRACDPEYGVEGIIFGEFLKQCYVINGRAVLIYF